MDPPTAYENRAKAAAEQAAESAKAKGTYSANYHATHAADHARLAAEEAKRARRAEEDGDGLDWLEATENAGHHADAAERHALQASW